MSEFEDRLDELFARALEMPAEERAAFVEREAGSDAALAGALRKMLDHDARAPGGFLAGGPADAPERRSLPSSIGPYRIVREIGRGGMGVVYEAEQDQPRRTVALKVMRQAIAGARMASRFRREAELLGRLGHPGIAQVYEAGEARAEMGSGPGYEVLYFAMELVRGRPIDQHADAHALGSRARLGLIAEVCDAVQHAHDTGVIHRDVKPDNILVDERGGPRVLDFGIARITDADVQTVTMRTEVGQLIGTVAYMSPEQLAGDPDAIDERTDVYSLGVVLFELLADRLPFDLSGKPIAEVARIVQQEDPTTLSTVDRTLRGDVETIVLTAMEKDPARRYGSPAALAADIRRYLGDEPLVARPASTLYQIKKFTRRNRALVGGLVASFVLLAAGIVGTSIGLVSALRANASLGDSNETLEAIVEFQATQLEQIDVARMGAEMRESLLAAAEAEGRRSELEAGLVGINFTDEARGALRSSVFRGTIDAIDAAFADRPLVRARLLQTMAGTLRELKLFTIALEPHEKALAIREAELGPDHPDTLLSLTQLGALLTLTGDQDGAEASYRRAAEVCRRDLGMDDARTLTAISGLGAVLSRRGDAEEAEALYLEALEARRRVLGDEHRDTLRTEANLALLYEDQGKLEEAEELARRAFEGRRRTLGEDHWETLATAGVLASILEDQGRHDEAIELTRGTLETRRRLLGNMHADTLGTVNNLAARLDALARFEEAEALYREALAGLRIVLGEDHPSALTATGNLGYVINAQGRPEEAEVYYGQALAGLRRAAGDDHPATLTAIGNYAAVLMTLGRQEEAEPLYLESLEGRRARFGDDHPSTLNAVYNMGDMLKLSGRLEQAEAYCERALEGYERVMGPDNIGTQHSLVLLGDLRMEQGRVEEAESLFERALESRTRTLGADHPDTELAAERLEEARSAASAG